MTTEAVTDETVPFDQIVASSKQSAQELGLRDTFFTELYESDDWSFIIKIIALVEICIAHAISHKLGVPSLSKAIESLDLGNRQSGKLVFAEHLEILPKSGRRIVREISKIRNYLAHDIRSVNFDINEYIEHLHDGQRREFVAAFSDMFHASAVRKRPKRVIWLATLSIVSVCYQTKNIVKLEAELALIRSKLLDHSIDFYRAEEK